MGRLDLVALGFMLVLSACGSPASVSGSPSPSSVAVTAPSPVVLHWMSFTHHQEPRNQLLYEGGGPNSFTGLRLLGPDGAVIATASPVPSAEQVLRMCGGNPKTGQAPPVYGALRVTLNLASQQQLSDIITAPERYRVEVLTGGSWQPAQLVNECHAQE